MKRKTCLGCDHLTQSEPLQVMVPYCGKTKQIVPHKITERGKKTVVMFKRIPKTCPLPKEEAHKQNTDLPEKEWETLTLKEKGKK